MKQEYDLAVIGAGPGGYIAALKATALKARVALIERDSFGGACLNLGCIPTKTLYQSSHDFLNYLHYAKIVKNHVNQWSKAVSQWAIGSYRQQQQSVREWNMLTIYVLKSIPFGAVA